jgi:hypothetical protein
MIIQIRATSGGGKTTLMRQLYAHAKCKPYHQEQMQRGGVKTLISKGNWQGLPFYVIGPYDTEGTGGCDRISTIEQVIQLVDDCAKRTQAKDGWHTGIVAFEGLLLAHSWGQMGEFLHDKYGDRYLNAFIDTSVAQCFKNVMARRNASGKGDPNDPERVAKIKKNVYDDYHRVELAYTRVIARGGQRVDIPYKRAFDATRDLIDTWALLYSGPKKLSR